jgi:hypothetical protein
LWSIPSPEVLKVKAVFRCAIVVAQITDKVDVPVRLCVAIQMLVDVCERVESCG